MHELVYAVTPPSLPGLNRLAAKLNHMKKSGENLHWHLGRWANEAKTSHVSRLDSEADAVAAAKHDA